MAKQTEFEQPPKGHIAPLIFDSVAKKWYAIKGSGYDYLKVDVESSDLPDGAATEAKQLPDGHNVTVDNTDIEVVQPTPADLRVSQHQYDGSTWRKSNLLFGYNDRWAEAVNGVASGAGNAEISTATVDPGYVYVIQSAAAYHDAAANKELIIYLHTGSVAVPILDVPSAPPLPYQVIAHSAVLKEGDYIFATAIEPGDGKGVWLRVWGYKMKINM